MHDLNNDFTPFRVLFMFYLNFIEAYVFLYLPSILSQEVVRLKLYSYVPKQKDVYIRKSIHAQRTHQFYFMNFETSLYNYSSVEKISKSNKNFEKIIEIAFHYVIISFGSIQCK